MVMQQNAVVQEDIEGLGEPSDDAWGDYPLDSFLVRNETRTVRNVLDRIQQGMYVMDPDFQREFIWDEPKQSKLIESVLMRIPLPVFYLAEDAQGRMVVVDGLQRLSTFKRFADNELRLQLPDRPELNRKRFEGLPAKLQNRFEDCNLILYVIDEKAPDRARLDIFDRVNSGEPLSRQQMRNCLLMGDATRFLKDEATTDLFLESTGRSLNWRRMRDREFVNRFCAFQLLGVVGYKGNMDDFLVEVLKKMNTSPGILGELSMKFRDSLKANLNVFGKHAFRKHTPDQEYRNVINAALWDVMSTGLSRYPVDIVLEKADALKTAFHGLIDDDEFNEAITYGTNDSRRVNYRFTAAEEMLESVFGA